MGYLPQVGAWWARNRKAIPRGTFFRNRGETKPENVSDGETEPCRRLDPMRGCDGGMPAEIGFCAWNREARTLSISCFGLWPNCSFTDISRKPFIGPTEKSTAVSNPQIYLLKTEKKSDVSLTDGWLELYFASCVIRQTRSLGALVLYSICNMVFVN